MTREVLVATRSAGKIRELRPLLQAAGWVARSLDDLGVVEQAAEQGIEVYESFLENAHAKARYFVPWSGGRPVLAEDSGLEVRALAGAPGVRSRRWAAREGLEGEALDAANNTRLLSSLEGVSDRGAEYVCAAVWWEGDRMLEALGRCAGRILVAPEGTGGFGYDPLFWSEELRQSFGEARAEAKATVSHRGRALRELLASVGAGR